MADDPGGIRPKLPCTSTVWAFLVNLNQDRPSTIAIGVHGEMGPLITPTQWFIGLAFTVGLAHLFNSSPALAPCREAGCRLLPSLSTAASAR
jgi:hypothetical protein